MKKISVILMNLGGPDSVSAIRPFLTNFFMDPAIIQAPWPIRFLLSRYIAFKRGGGNGPAATSYALLGGKSPLLENTQAQAQALQQMLNATSNGDQYIVRVVMRYWHPQSAEVVAQTLKDCPDEIILLPLYPQFSTTTSGSSIKDWKQAAARAGLDIPTKTICCYPDHTGFIAASVDRIVQAYQRAAMIENATSLPFPRLLFSAHGLPVKIIKQGDPYQSQCEKTAALIAEGVRIALSREHLDWQVCYQSRVGPLEWTRPSTEEALERAGHDKIPVIIYPHAFVSEHVETLVEIEHEYREFAEKAGIPAFIRAETVMTHPAFIQGLADMVQTARDPSTAPLAPATASCQCDPQWKQCACRMGL